MMHCFVIPEFPADEFRQKGESIPTPHGKRQQKEETKRGQKKEKLFSPTIPAKSQKYAENDQAEKEEVGKEISVAEHRRTITVGQ